MSVFFYICKLLTHQSITSEIPMDTISYRKVIFWVMIKYHKISSPLFVTQSFHTQNHLETFHTYSSTKWQKQHSTRWVWKERCKSYGRKLRQPFHFSRPEGSLSLLHQIFSFTQNGGRRPNICLGPNSGKNDVQRDSQNSTENTSKSFSWDKCCGKINAQTVFTGNFPFSIFETHTSCTMSFEAFYLAFILGKGAIWSWSYKTIILWWGSLYGFFF